MAVMLLQVSVAVPDPCIVVWSKAQVKPVGAETVSVTVPVKPETGDTVMVDVVDWVEVVEAGVVDVRVMSWVWNVNDEVACEVRELLVPMTVTVKVPSCEEWQSNDALTAEEAKGRLAGLIGEQVSPLGSDVSERLTVPVNPLTGVIVIDEVAVWPVVTAAGDVADILKPLT